jgi:hypothetical protein
METRLRTRKKSMSLNASNNDSVNEELTEEKQTNILPERRKSVEYESLKPLIALEIKRRASLDNQQNAGISCWAKLFCCVPNKTIDANKTDTLEQDILPVTQDKQPTLSIMS